jgi:diguanylate cyclase (GGDEF)-like protein
LINREGGFLRILVADDDPTSRLLLESLLTKWGYEPISAADGSEAWEVLQMPDGPHMALLDWVMPKIQGDELCRRVRKMEEGKDTHLYLILLTAKRSTDHIIRGIEAGADDYIPKPFDEGELRVRVRAGQRMIQLHSQLLAAKSDLLVQSRTDSLTGVLNRRAILSQMETELSRAKRHGKQISLALLDIDHFKAINDTYGHWVGDAVLKECVKRIESVTRAYDSLGRFGGEEFLILFPETGESEASSICNRIRDVIAEKPVRVGKASIPLTVSQGVITGIGQETMDELVHQADQGMYQAKEKGRNRVERIEKGAGFEERGRLSLRGDRSGKYPAHSSPASKREE